MSNKRPLLFAAIVLIGCGLDLWTKHLAFEAVPTPMVSDRIEVIDGFFYIAHLRNPGAMWSSFQDVPREIWIILRGAISALLLFWYLRSHHIGRWLEVSYAFILGGALGNLYDNIFALNGHVRDFVLWVFFGWPFPVFNIADAMISVGATMMVLSVFAEELRLYRSRRQRKAEADAVRSAD